jgi:hypothetical protein
MPHIVVLPDSAHIAYHNRLHAISGNDFYRCKSVEIAHLNNPLTNLLPNCNFGREIPELPLSNDYGRGYKSVLIATQLDTRKPHMFLLDASITQVLHQELFVVQHSASAWHLLSRSLTGSLSCLKGHSVLVPGGVFVLHCFYTSYMPKNPASQCFF